MSLKNTVNGIGSGISRAFDKPELWLIRCVLVASIIAVVYYSGDKAKDGPTQAILIFLGLAAVGFHYVGAKKACAAWYNRSLGGLFAWTLVISGAIVWEVNSQMGISSANQDNLSTIQRTSALGFQDAREAVNHAARKRDELRKEAAWQATVDPVDAVQSKIDAAKAHRFWSLTDQCSEPKGKQTREFCTSYRQHVADKATAVRKAELAVEIERADKEWKDAQAKAGSVKAVASMDRADLRNLKRLTGLGDSDLELSQSLLVVLVMALFLTVAGWLIKAEEFANVTPKPWINWRGMITRARKLWDGKDHTEHHYHAVTPVRTADGWGIAKVA